MTSENTTAEVRSASSIRIAKQEASALAKRISQQERGTLIEYRELGLRLRSIKAALKHGEYGPFIESIGLSSQRASDAVTVAEYWNQIPARAGIWDFLKAKKENIFLQAHQANDPQEVQATPEIEGEDAEPFTSNPPVDQEPPPASGDAAEELPPDPLLDCDGLVLPESARAAWLCTAIEDWITEFCRPAFASLDRLRGQPGTVHTDIDAIKKKWHAIANMLRSSKPTHRCRHCSGAGCKGCKQVGWVSKAIWSEEKKREKSKEWHRRQSSNAIPD